MYDSYFTKKLKFSTLYVIVSTGIYFILRVAQTECYSYVYPVREREYCPSFSRLLVLFIVTNALLTLSKNFSKR